MLRPYLIALLSLLLSLTSPALIVAQKNLYILNHGNNSFVSLSPDNPRPPVTLVTDQGGQRIRTGGRYKLARFVLSRKIDASAKLDVSGAEIVPISVLSNSSAV